MIRKAVIPAAGFGTRVLPMTKAVPKEMLPIVDKPSIQYIVEECVKSGITDILVITTRGKEAIDNDDIDDLDMIIDAVGVQLIGVVPEDPEIPMSTGKGAALASSTQAFTAFSNIARRVKGDSIPIEIK